MKPPVDNNNRGSNGIARWLELQKGGGTAPTTEEIKTLLSTRRDQTIEREELKRLIEEYFRECTSQEVDELTGETITVWRTAPTKSKLALKLGVSKSTLMNAVCGGYGVGHNKPYMGGHGQRIDESDFDLVRLAYSVIESYYESLLSQNRNNAGTIFWMLNSGRSEWLNESKVNVSAQQESYAPEQTAAEVAQRYNNVELLPPPEEM